MADKPVRVKYTSLVIIWLTLLISQPIFALVIYFIKPELFDLSQRPPVMSTQPLIILAFIVAAIAFFILSQVLNGQHIRRAAADHDPGCIQTGLVLGCALSEVPTLLGVILAFVWGYHYFFAWMILGTIGILLNFPRKSSLEAADGEL
jgi:hypothetical protein